MFKITLQPNLIYPLVIAFVGNEQRKQNRTQAFPTVAIAFTCGRIGYSQHMVKSSTASGEAMGCLEAVGVRRHLPWVPSHRCHLLNISPSAYQLSYHSSFFLQFPSLIFPAIPTLNFSHTNRSTPRIDPGGNIAGRRLAKLN